MKATRGRRGKRSPLREPPLPSPGEWLERERERELSEGAMPWVVFAVMAVVLAGVEWSRYFTGSPPRPYVFTLVAAGAVSLSFFRVRKRIPYLRQLYRGAEGEKVVGQMLEGLRKDGYQVLHDVPGEGFNVDHVIVGPAGVFVIETKTISKPVRGDVRVSYDGKRVLVNGFKPDRDPIAQANAAAGYVRGLISKSTGRKTQVRPVVLYPGWFVERQPKGADVWVLNPKSLESFLKHEDEVLNPEDVQHYYRILEINVRAAMKHG